METSGKHAPGGSSTFVPVRSALVPQGPAVQSLLSCPRGRPHPARSLLWARPVLLAASPRSCGRRRPTSVPHAASLLLCSGSCGLGPVRSLLPLPCSPPGSLSTLFLSLPSDPCGPHPPGFRPPGAALCGWACCAVDRTPALPALLLALAPEVAVCFFLPAPAPWLPRHRPPLQPPSPAMPCQALQEALGAGAAHPGGRPAGPPPKRALLPHPPPPARTRGPSSSD